MSYILAIKNAFQLLFLGEWREFVFRLRVYLGQVDLNDSSLEDLKLSEDRCYHYANSGGLHLDRVLKRLNITPEDSIIDFGSGKGGALFTFSKHPFRKITGCEISPDLAQISMRNLEMMNVRNVDVVVSDAADFGDLDDYNYFYFFNPFPASVMRSVMKNIQASLLRRRRRTVLIYFNPECHETILETRFFRQIDEYRDSGPGIHLYSNDTQFLEVTESV